MSRKIDNTLVMRQEETYNEIVRFLSENYAPCVDKDFIKSENKKMLAEQIDNIINEELGIADEVVKLSDIIEKNVYDNINKGITEKVFNVKTELSDVNVDFVYKEFNTPEEALNWMNETGRYDGYSYETNTIYLGLYFIGGVMNTFDINDTIMHECSHYWECKNAGGTVHTDTYDTIYQGTKNRNPVISTICELLYYSNRNEITAFVNGTFSSAMKKNKKYVNYIEFIKENGINDLYTLLKNSQKTLSKYDMNNSYFFIAAYWLVGHGVLHCDIEHVLPTLKMITKRSYQYLMTKIGKAYALYTAKFKEREEKIKDAKMKMMLRKYWKGDT